MHLCLTMVLILWHHFRKQITETKLVSYCSSSSNFSSSSPYISIYIHPLFITTYPMKVHQLVTPGNKGNTCRHRGELHTPLKGQELLAVWQRGQLLHHQAAFILNHLVFSLLNSYHIFPLYVCTNTLKHMPFFSLLFYSVFSPHYLPF